MRIIHSELEELDFYDDLRIESFVLKNFYKDFYVKEYNNKIEFKKVPKHYFMQAKKIYFNKVINEADRKFYFEGEIATFDKEI